MKKFRQKNSDSEQQPARRRQRMSDGGERSSRSTKQFQLGRTLTGSSSPKVASGNELNADILSPRAKSHHLSARRKSLGWKLALALTACLMLYVFVGQISADISARVTPSVSQQIVGAYQSSVDEYFAVRPVERFYPSLNRDSFSQFMQSKHPEIQQARIELGGGFGKAQLQVSLREPVARWTIRGSNEYVDADGIVFKENAYRASGSLVQIVDNAGVPEPSSGVVASQRFLSFVGIVVGDMKRRGYTVTKATIPPLTTRQLSFQVRGVPYQMYFSTDRKAGEQTEDTARMVRYLKQRGIKPTYIDVRVKGKAFYK